MSLKNEAVKVVAEYFHVKPADITGDGKSQSMSHARQVVMYVLWRSGMSLPQVGDWMGRNHTTILHGIRALQTRMADDEELAQQVAHVTEQVLYPNKRRGWQPRPATEADRRIAEKFKGCESAAMFK